jgi:hypothetical protein
MTRQEIEKKVASLKISLDVLRLYEMDIVKKVGRRPYTELINDVLDQYQHYLKLLKKIDKQ